MGLAFGSVVMGCQRTDEEIHRLVDERIATAIAGIPTETLTPTATPQPTTTPRPTVTPQPTATPTTWTGTIIVPRLHIAPIAKDIPAYKRADWEPWIDADGDCQNTRAEVLIDESLVPVEFTSDQLCVVARGKWLALYIGSTIEVARGLHIDHMVPL